MEKIKIEINDKISKIFLEEWEEELSELTFHASEIEYYAISFNGKRKLVLDIALENGIYAIEGETEEIERLYSEINKCVWRL